MHEWWHLTQLDDRSRRVHFKWDSSCLVLISATIHPLYGYGCIASKISKTKSYFITLIRPLTVGTTKCKHIWVCKGLRDEYRPLMPLLSSIRIHRRAEKADEIAAYCDGTHPSYCIPNYHNFFIQICTNLISMPNERAVNFWTLHSMIEVKHLNS